MRKLGADVGHTRLDGGVSRYGGAGSVGDGGVSDNHRPPLLPPPISLPLRRCALVRSLGRPADLYTVRHLRGRDGTNPQLHRQKLLLRVRVHPHSRRLCLFALRFCLPVHRRIPEPEQSETVTSEQ